MTHFYLPFFFFLNQISITVTAPPDPPFILGVLWVLQNGDNVPQDLYLDDLDDEIFGL